MEQRSNGKEDDKLARRAMEGPSMKFENNCEQIQIQRENAGQCALCGIQTHRLITIADSTTASTIDGGKHQQQPQCEDVKSASSRQQGGQQQQQQCEDNAKSLIPTKEPERKGKESELLSTTPKGEEQKQVIGSDAVSKAPVQEEKQTGEGTIAPSASAAEGEQQKGAELDAAATSQAQQKEPIGEEKSEEVKAASTSPVEEEKKGQEANVTGEGDTASNTSPLGPLEEGRNGEKVDAVGAPPMGEEQKGVGDSAANATPMDETESQEVNATDISQMKEGKKGDEVNASSASPMDLEQKGEAQEKKEERQFDKAVKAPIGFTTIREPLTNEYVFQGRCLLCHPLPHSNNTEKQTQTESSNKEEPSAESPMDISPSKENQNISIVTDMEYTIASFDKAPGKYSGPIDDEKKPHGSAGTFVLESNGQKRTYKGDFYHGHIKGRGILKFCADGKTMYDGQWDNDQANGTGISVTKEGDMYQGEFVNNERSGNGILTKANGDQFVGQWKQDRRNGHGYFVWSGGDKYVGEWANDRRDGRGVFSWADGENYIGNFADSRKHGAGIYTWMNGDRYDGEFWHGRMSGYGIFTKVNGQKYAGAWKDDKREGHGVATWTSGHYTGEWAANKFHGHGVFTWSDKDSYSGEWKNSVRHGKGTYTDAAGNAFEGEWKDDQLVSTIGDNVDAAHIRKLRHDRSLSIDDDDVVGGNTSKRGGGAGKKTDDSSKAHKESADAGKSASDPKVHKADPGAPMEIDLVTVGSGDKPSPDRSKNDQGGGDRSQVSAVSGASERTATQGADGKSDPKVSKSNVNGSGDVSSDGKVGKVDPVNGVPFDKPDQKTNLEQKKKAGDNHVTIVDIDKGTSKAKFVGDAESREQGGSAVNQGAQIRDKAGKRSSEDAGITSTTNQAENSGKKSSAENEPSQADFGMDDFGFGDDLMGHVVVINDEDDDNRKRAKLE